MATGVVSLRYLVLGLLAQRPMSGYDIKRFLKDLDWLIGSPSGGSLYPILRSLLEDELVTVEVVPGIDRPPRKIYHLAEAGRHALCAWLDEPVAVDAPLKAFVMRLLLAESHIRPRLLSHLEGRRAQVAARRDRLVDGQGRLDGDLGRRLAIGYGLALAEAELHWLDSTCEWLSEQPLPKEGGDSAGPGAIA